MIGDEIIGGDGVGRLTLPSDDPDEWTRVVEVLSQPLEEPTHLDAIISRFQAMDPDRETRTCSFFASVPGSADAGDFDFDQFFLIGAPVLIEMARSMKELFPPDCPEGRVPIFKSRCTWKSEGPHTLVKMRHTLTRRQCACLLAHSLLGSLRRPSSVHRNDFRFTAVDLFVGTAVSPGSATTLLNYFTMLGKHGFPEGNVTFERRGYPAGHPPWEWEGSDRKLCGVVLRDGSIDDCPAPLHVEFANAFVGGGVMTGDAAMEEILFLVKPELMVAMALQNRMVDTEVVMVSGALKYSTTSGYGHSLKFAGEYDDPRKAEPPSVCAIDAIRGGGPAMSEVGMLRDMDKARIAFDGATEVGTGHWGCGAFGNNHDLMFLKQWLAASEAGVERIYYYDFDRKQSHSIFPLSRKLKHLTVGQLWAFLRGPLAGDLKPFDVASFSRRIADVAVGRLKVPSSGC